MLRKRSRSERSLYWRCRRGEPEALNTFAYRVADDLYAMALAACEDEAAAAETVLEAWQRTLARLGRWRFGGYLERRARREMCAVLRARAGAARARAASGVSATDYGEDASRPRLPEGTVAELLAMAEEAGPDLQRRATWRRRRRQTVTAVAAAVAVAAVALGTAYRIYLSEPSTRAVRVQVLRERILAGDMVNLVRDVGDTLPDPDGADRAEAELLGQVTMALEEMANAGNTPGTEGLHYVQERVKQLDLSTFLLAEAQRQQGDTKDRLMQAQLALEEVAAL